MLDDDDEVDSGLIIFLNFKTGTNFFLETLYNVQCLNDYFTKEEDDTN